MGHWAAKGLPAQCTDLTMFTEKFKSTAVVTFTLWQLLKVPSHCCDLSCNVIASCGRSGIACSWPGVVLRSHKLAIGLL